jgi:hypothetical protein
MTIPHDEDIQKRLLDLLKHSFDGTMHCNDVYSSLAKQFPELSDDEKSVPYQTSLSKWSNRVQFARLHCVNKELLYSAKAGPAKGRGFWTITEKGREHKFDDKPRIKQIRANPTDIDSL